MNAIRVRFAPSPTGHLHIGGLRTALFNWLFARHNKGVFLLRIEDTDFERSKPEFTTSILESLSWAGIESDEPLVTQSQRMPMYRQMVDKLLKEGKAYRCFCAPSGVGETADGYTKYAGTCRNLSPKEQDLSKPSAVRIKIPDDLKQIGFDDLIRGPIIFDRDQFDDFIIARSDGIPIYNFVVVVDDAQMQISHIIRGEDHISNTPKQIILYQAFDFKTPYFAHVPLILGPTGARLSKRDAATAVTDYKKNGYLADALCNYLVRLGWSHGDQEVFTRQEMINYFSLDAIGKKGAIFDQNKLDWMNGIYIRNASPHDLLDYIVRDVEPPVRNYLAGWSEEKIEHAITLYQERVKTLKELVQELRILHDGQKAVNAEDQKKWVGPETARQLGDLLQRLKALPVFDIDLVSSQAKEVAAHANIKMVALAQPLRLALIGKSSGPGVFEMLTFLGKDESCKRIADFIKSLQ